MVIMHMVDVGLDPVCDFQKFKYGLYNTMLVL
jgi:hypothetical protein